MIEEMRLSIRRRSREEAARLVEEYRMRPANPTFFLLEKCGQLPS